MDIVIADAMINLILKAIESQRPELLGAHSTGYPFTPADPWSNSAASDPVVLKANGTTVDYDARGSAPLAQLFPGQLAISLKLNAFIQRSRPKASSERDQFFVQVNLSGTFGPKAKRKGGYPLVLDRFQLGGLEPTGVQTLLSWLLAGSLTEALAESTFPSTISLIAKKLDLGLAPPAIEQGQIRLTGNLEGLR